MWRRLCCDFSRRNIGLTDGDRETIGLHAQLACIWEATARKPGNVHRFVDFDDLTYLDFLTSAAAVAPVLARFS